MNKRITKKFSDKPISINQVLHWADNHSNFLYLNGNQYPALHDPFPQMIFIGSREIINSNENSFEKLEQLIQKKDWLYGFFTYELKNEIEKLESKNPETVPVPHMSFAIPETIIKFEKEAVEILSFQYPEKIMKEIISTPIPIQRSANKGFEPRSRTIKRQYIRNVNKIKEAIVEGEFYEMNYCIEYSYTAAHFNPISGHEHLNSISPMPFSALLKSGPNYLICASPERFLKKEGDKIISQPIKGTTKRSFDKSEDERLKNDLLQSEKERAENLMIVDLVRNDLARTSLPGSVKVEELFGIYTFKRIHQMISTVVSKFNSKNKISDIIKNAFPMGSMTGAPKIRVMEEIEKLEDSARGLYSGSVGFFTPNGDFDLNVVIRSLVFDDSSGKISFHVGSAITYDSDPEYEYNECLLKAETLFEALSSQS